MTLDKGYDYADVRTAIARRGYVEHIRCRGEEQRACRRGTRTRRWVVERTHSWFNRFRKLLIRWEKKARNYHALVVFAGMSREHKAYKRVPEPLARRVNPAADHVSYVNSAGRRPGSPTA